MNEEEAFLKALRENPDDEATRAAYADWLQERGDIRGEFLRLEVELQRLHSRLKQLEEQLDPTWLLTVRGKGNLKLVSFPPFRKIDAIRLVRQWTNLGLKEAKDLVEAAPVVFLKAVPFSEALRIQKHFQESSIEVQLDPSV